MPEQRRRMSAKEEFAAMKQKKAEDAAALDAAEEARKKGLVSGVVGGAGHVGDGGRTTLARSTSSSGFEGKRRLSVKERKDFDRRMSNIETKWYQDAALIQEWDPKKKELFLAVKRFVAIIYVGETRKMLDGMPAYVLTIVLFLPPAQCSKHGVAQWAAG